MKKINLIKSEFGKGLTYNLSLFLKHAERTITPLDKENSRMWFYGAADHIQELEIPENLPATLKERITDFSNKVWKWRGFEKPEPTQEDKEWAIKEATLILLEIDKTLGIDAKEAEYD